MSLSVRPYGPGDLEQMTARYRAQAEAEPHIAPLGPERFTELVASKSYFDAGGVLVARRGGEVLGWVHACLAPGSEPHHSPDYRPGRIRMLVYPPDRLEVGQALVAEATAWLRARSHGELEAMHAKAGYPFYRGLWMGGEPMAPATLPHLQLAFEVGGYKSTQESIFMTAAFDSPPPETRAEIEVELEDSPAEMRHEPMAESWAGFAPMRTRARRGGEEIGDLGWVILPHVAEKLGAPCLSIWCLGVREQHRRKGVAGALISRALRQGYAQGARFGSVGTQLWNAPAHATYARFGFRPSRLLIGRTLAAP